MHRFARLASALRSYRDADEAMSLLDIGVALKQGRWPPEPVYEKWQGSDEGHEWFEPAGGFTPTGGWS